MGLNYWWNAQDHIPSVRQMAFDHISMSAETERVFSDTKLFIPESRSRLGPAVIEALEYVRRWVLAGLWTTTMMFMLTFFRSTPYSRTVGRPWSASVLVRTYLLAYELRRNAHSTWPKNSGRGIVCSSHRRHPRRF